MLMLMILNVPLRGIFGNDGILNGTMNVNRHG